MDKLALMAPLKLPNEDSIQLLINGISSNQGSCCYIKSRFSWWVPKGHATYHGNLQWCSLRIKKSPTTFRNNKLKNQSRPNSSKSDQEKKLFCSYCRGRNHIKEDCFKLKRKEQPVNSTQLKKNVPPSTVAFVSEPPKKRSSTPTTPRKS